MVRNIGASWFANKESLSMHASNARRFSSSLCLLLALAAAAVPAFASAGERQAGSASASGERIVDCLVPGQIHSIGGVPSLGPRRLVRVTAAACGQRGGEYTVVEPARPAAAVAQAPLALAKDTRVVNCLLPRQLRQLGTKLRYRTARRSILTTRPVCQSRGGEVISSVRARRANREYRASLVKPVLPKKRP